VNENIYMGPRSAGVFCLGPGADPELGVTAQRFRPITITPQSFVIADRLAFCRFSYLRAMPPPEMEEWIPNWILMDKWPKGMRIEMASLDADPSRLKPLTITAAVHVDRYPIFEYGDF
jgi:hypothetical protein